MQYVICTFMITCQATKATGPWTRRNGHGPPPTPPAQLRPPRCAALLRNAETWELRAMTWEILGDFYGFQMFHSGFQMEFHDVLGVDFLEMR